MTGTPLTTSPTTQATATTPAILGLHHVTAITEDAQTNIDFYTGVLGLRMVKVTINYDDPGTYHLYYGDGLGRPGTIMTFFAWPGGRRGVSGTGQVSETAFAVPVGSLDYWATRLAERGVAGVSRATRFGQAVLTFVDPDGLQLALVESPVEAAHYWDRGGVPADRAIHGFHSVTLVETDGALPASVLVDRFGYREVGREGNRARYALPGDGAARLVDVVTVSQRAYPGVGTGQVHHVAFRTPDDAAQARWLELLRGERRNVSPVMDRDYFHSIYFREPGGVLFEIATDNPGFTKNEAPEALGTRVMLPGWLEPARADVERVLPKIRLAEPVR
jgi:glyoxalase family protein